MPPYQLLSLTVISSLGALALATSAQAEPARAAQAACTAAAPAPGVSFSGPVLQVTDAGALCVALGPTPAQWVAVRPAGLVKTAAQLPKVERAVMMSAAFSRRLDCVAGPSAGGVVEAVCTVDGARLSDQVDAAHGGQDWQIWR